jgi:hypothetical protein
MNNSADKTLLALMLTLNDVNITLSQEEKAAFRNVADQLSLDPDAWESDIEPELLATLEQNPALSQQFLAIKSQIDAVGDIPQELMPTAQENAQLSNENVVVTRGFTPVGEVEEFETNEINNMAISILSSSEPEETAKQVSSFESLKSFLSKPIF